MPMPTPVIALAHSRNAPPRYRWLAPSLLAVSTVAAAAIATRRATRTSFRGQVVVITGGSRGLGLALARAFASDGATLFLISRTREDLVRVMPELAARGASVSAAVCDVRDVAAVNDTIAKIAADAGGIDVLVNNAGVIQAMPFEHAQLSDFEDSMATHFWGPLFFIRACLPIMKSQRRGHIVNVASIGGRVGVPHLSPYCAGKFALVGLSETLRAELRKDRIHVTTVTPGLMRTGSHRNVVVRGRHRQEARWFALASASPLTSMSAERAARSILAAVRKGRAHVTPGWQARVAALANAFTPELFAAAMATVTSTVLPRPAHANGNTAAWSRDIDLGWIESILAVGASRRHNQPLPIHRP
jgi:short-subunit dehydrogenase